MKTITTSSEAVTTLIFHCGICGYTSNISERAKKAGWEGHTASELKLSKEECDKLFAESEPISCTTCILTNPEAVGFYFPSEYLQKHVSHDIINHRKDCSSLQRNKRMRKALKLFYEGQIPHEKGESIQFVVKDWENPDFEML